MAKSSNGKNTNGGSSETRAQRAPARRRTSKKTVEAIAVSPDMGNQNPGAVGLTEDPSREEVQRLAYELYVRRGGQHGGDLDDWFEAERRLRRVTRH